MPNKGAPLWYLSALISHDTKSGVPAAEHDADLVRPRNCRKSRGGELSEEDRRHVHLGKSKDPWSVLFSTNPFLPHAYAYVDRARFDKLLLDNTEDLGAEVHYGVSVKGPITEDGRVVGVRAEFEGGESVDVRGKMVIDASGRASVIGRGSRTERSMRK